MKISSGCSCSSLLGQFFFFFVYISLFFGFFFVDWNLIVD